MYAVFWIFDIKEVLRFVFPGIMVFGYIKNAIIF